MIVSCSTLEAIPTPPKCNQGSAGRHLTEKNTGCKHCGIEAISVVDFRVVLQCLSRNVADGVQAEFLEKLDGLLFKINERILRSRYYQILDLASFKMILFCQREYFFSSPRAQLA